METRTSNKPLFIGIGAVAAIIVVGVIGFTSGVNYQKSHAKTQTATASTAGGPQMFQNSDGSNGPRTFRGGPGAENGTFGTVSAVSATSVTVKNTNTGESTTYAITSSTQIVKDGTIAAYTDIATDSTVMITADSKTTSNALRIMIDPALGPQNSSVDSNSVQTN